jgi:hypothetical protein
MVGSKTTNVTVIETGAIITVIILEILFLDGLPVLILKLEKLISITKMHGIKLHQPM